MSALFLERGYFPADRNPLNGAMGDFLMNQCEDFGIKTEWRQSFQMGWDGEANEGDKQENQDWIETGREAWRLVNEDRGVKS